MEICFELFQYFTAKYLCENMVHNNIKIVCHVYITDLKKIFIKYYDEVNSKS